MQGERIVITPERKAKPSSTVTVDTLAGKDT